MPTELQFWTWLSLNWPNVTMGLTAGIVYVVAYLRLRKFLSRVGIVEGAMVTQALEIIRLKSQIGDLTKTHCRKYPEDIEKLIKFEEPSHEPTDRTS